MNTKDDLRCLASYVTFRQLYNDGKNDVYFIIPKFAEYILISEKMYMFGLIDISTKMQNQFGFISEEKITIYQSEKG